jgi:hypothetical protein
MNNYLISSFFKIWLLVEKVDDSSFRAIFVNKERQQVMVPEGIQIHNDHKQYFLEKNSQQCFTLSNTDNHTIYLNGDHILDFSHSRLWKVNNY